MWDCGRGRATRASSQPQLRITKEGDIYLRKLLVQGAHCILGQRGPDTDLKTLGVEAGRNVAARTRRSERWWRWLGSWRILLHRLWVSGEVYEPLRNSNARQAAAQRQPRKGIEFVANRRVRVTARSRQNKRSWKPDVRVRDGDGSTRFKIKDANRHRGGKYSLRVRMEAGRVGGCEVQGRRPGGAPPVGRRRG